MPSLIPGYNYDIFISYRQNDNKYDGWVTEFVDNLKKELEASIKDKISVYFDINPTDGLLETDSVNKSLEGKLKCLIFIPIISRTYCDPKSFAWQYEFCAFNSLSRTDKFGIDIKLANGNVTGRILPVKIHDLDPEDTTLLENEIGGVLRSIEFIYRSAGVNRPLRADEDHPRDNLNKTYYRDQINKVANAVKDIITALKKSEHPEETSQTPNAVKKPENKKKNNIGIITAGVILSVLVTLGIVFWSIFKEPSTQGKKTIAVLPFKWLSDEADKQYIADGMMDAILLHLSKINDLNVLSRTSVEQYRGTTKTARKIGRELDVEYILEGSFQKHGDDARLIVQLIRTKKEGHLWADEYNSSWREIFSVQSQVAQTIARELDAVITPEEKGLIEKIPTSSLSAYDLYLKANEYLRNYFSSNDPDFYKKAITLFSACLEVDTAFARAWSGMAMAYYNRYYYESYFKENFLDSCLILADRALAIDNRLDEAYYVKGLYLSNKGLNEEALYNLDQAIKANPNYYQAYSDKGRILIWIQHDYVSGLENYYNAFNLIRDKSRPGIYANLARAYHEVGFFEKAKGLYLKELDLTKNEVSFLTRMAWLEFSNENYSAALDYTRKAQAKDTALTIELNYFFGPGDYKDEALKNVRSYVAHNRRSGSLILQQSHRVGWVYWINGMYKEAEYYFNQQIKYSEESIKLNRTIAQRKAAQYDLAGTYAFLGKKEKAYQYLDEFNTMNFFPRWWISLAKTDPLFDSIRNEDHFQKVLQNMIAKNEAEHERVGKWLEENNK
jgi:TolB-like protein/Tfp pilus assembly protein PilF